MAKTTLEIAADATAAATLDRLMVEAVPQIGQLGYQVLTTCIGAMCAKLGPARAAEWIDEFIAAFRKVGAAVDGEQFKAAE